MSDTAGPGGEMRHYVKPFLFTFAVFVWVAPVAAQIKPGDRRPRFGDPCGMTLPSGELPSLLDAALALNLEGARLDAIKDPVFEKAWVAVLGARNDLSNKESTQAKAEGALLSRMSAQREHDGMLRSAELATKTAEIDTVCAEVVRLRNDLTRDANKRQHEITLLREELERLRKGVDAYSYISETQRLLSEAKDAKAAIQRLSRDIATAIAQRDRLRALLAGR